MATAPELSDNHSHIILSPIESMVAAAKRKKIRHFSITEHISQFQAPRSSIVFNSTHSRGRMFRDFQEYDAEFEKIGSSESLELRRGLEVDYIPKYKKTIAEYVNQEKWDILLCSVHELSDGREVESGPPLHDGQSSADRWREYMEIQKQTLESDLIPFNVLTHPVRLFLGTPNYPSDLDVMLLDLAEMARKAGKALELNGKDIEESEELVEKVALACSKAGCKISLGSDAHSPDTVYRGLAKARKIAERLKLEIRV